LEEKKMPTFMSHESLDEMIAQMANMEEDTHQYQAYKLEIERRQTIALLKATEAQEGAAKAAKQNAKYMLWSVIAAAVSAIASLASTAIAVFGQR
jgi:hypothetical protein